MPKFIVEKRVINNYLVEVEANSPAEAIRNAAEGLHTEGELTSEHEDGDDFYPSDWRVYDPRQEGEDRVEIEDFDRAMLNDLD